MTYRIPGIKIGANPQKRKVSKSGLLPKFLPKDINGEFIDSAKLYKKYTYIQFAKSYNGTDKELFIEVASNYSAKMNIVLILEPSLNIDNWPRGSGTRIIHDEGNRLRKIFNVPTFGFYFIFDPRGRTVGSGMSQVGYINGPKYILRSNVDGFKFNNEMCIPPKGRALRDYYWLSQLDQRIRNNPRKFVLVCLFSSICEGCPSGEFLNRLKKFYPTFADVIDVLYLFPPDYTENDLRALSSQLSTNFPVEIADSILGEKWKELIFAYGREAVSGLVFVASRAGHIVRVLDNGQSFDQFFDDCLRLSIGE